MLSFFLLQPPPALAWDEAHLFGLNDFEEFPSCNTSLNDLSWANDQADAFDTVLEAWIDLGYWDESLSWGSAGAPAWAFMDIERDELGDDAHSAHGIDEADIGYVSTHGNHVCNESEHNSYFYPGVGTAGECAVHTAGEADADVLYGNPANGGDMEIMILDACETGQYCVWENGGYDDVNGDELQVWASYHGKSYDNAGQVDALEDYVLASRTSGVGDNWLDYRFDERGLGADQCPTVIIWGSSSSNRDNMFYYGGLDDWIASPDEDALSSFYYICDCNPADGDPVGC